MRTRLVGLQDSGKSTALAALWFSVAERSEDCAWYLANSDRPDDPAVWLALRDRWLEGTPPQRTEHEPKPPVLSLRLTPADSHREKIELVVPDIAGEDYQRLYEVGRFPGRHADILSEADHIVLFVRVDDYDHPVRPRAPRKSSEGEASPEPSGVEWKPEEMYPASKIVAVLRGIKQLCEGCDFRLTVALTAWDLVKTGTPAVLLRRRFPLLDQYLRTNFDGFGLVGLSAQGCSYDDPKSMKSIRFDDIRRIRVAGETEHSDITRVFA